MNRQAPSSESKPSRTRTISFRNRRILTWSLLSAAIVVIGVEAHAHFGYERSLDRLKNVLQFKARLNAVTQTTSALTLDQAAENIYGWTFKTDHRPEGKAYVSYRWPSMFKTYVLHIVVDVDGDLVTIDTSTEGFVGDQAIVANRGNRDAFNKDSVFPLDISQAVIPRVTKGFAQAPKGTVALATHDVETASDTYGDDPDRSRFAGGVLARELIRQAFAIAAREELQRIVLDESLGDDVGSDDLAISFPYEVHAEISKTGQLTIDVVRRDHGKSPLRRRLEPFQLSEERYYESLLEYVEELSRTAFPDILRESGITGEANTFLESSIVPPDIEMRLHYIDEMSQLSVVRELHALIRRDGESPERLAALARAYANLGSLTELHWRLHHKVFKARALLFAQRLVIAGKGSPWGFAHRGYAWALAGRLQTATDDIRKAEEELADSAQESKLPRWIVDARAFCDYDRSFFDSATGNDKPLANYLRLLSADPKGGQAEFLAAIQTLLKSSPGCARAYMSMAEVDELGLCRRLAEGELQNSWTGIYQAMQKLPDLPADAVVLIDKHASGSQVGRNEPVDRAELIRILRTSSNPDADPILGLFALLLEEISFWQADFRLYVRDVRLGAPADDLVNEMAPTIDAHPYAALIRSGVSHPQTSRTEFQHLIAALKPTELDFNAKHAIVAAYKKDSPQSYGRLFYQALRHQDWILSDLLREINYNPDSTRDQVLAHYLNAVAPQRPQSVARRIRADGINDQDDASAIENRYDKSPIVLQAIADWYSSRGKYDDAIRCLKQRIAVAPEVAAYQDLAKIYAFSNDRDKWKETLDAALRIPSLGLEHAIIANELAWYHMHRNELALAKPYADAAAQSYSAWGLMCAAHCYERLGRMDEAERLFRACGERYDTSSLLWFFWCRRTGRGDESAAKRLAEKNVDQYRQLAPEDQLELAIFHLIENNPAAALEILLKSMANRFNGYDGLLAASIAASQGETKHRDTYLQRVAENSKDSPLYAELADLIISILNKQSEAHWNDDVFRRLLAKCDKGEATNFYYFAGYFLALHDSPEKGLEYLQLAASSPRFEKHCALLATLELRRRNLAIPSMRSLELGGDLTDLTLLKDELADCWKARQFDRVVELLTPALEERDAWSFLLVDRGLAHERLGQYQSAIDDYELAIQRNPVYYSAHHELAMLRGACEDAAFRDPAEALVHAQKSFDLVTTKSFANHTCLAVALAANGDFEKAVQHQQQALNGWPDSSRDMAKERLKLFRENKPYIRQRPAP